MEQFYKFNELTNYPVIIAQLSLSPSVTALIGVNSSRFAHIMMNTLPELHFSLQATLYNHNW